MVWDEFQIYAGASEPFRLFYPDRRIAVDRGSGNLVFQKKRLAVRRETHMRAFTIKNLKDFMNQLLLADTFDYFSVSEATITTFVTFSIDGSLHPDFYDSDTAARLKAAGKSQVRWSGIKSWCYSVIRGKRTPVSFRFIFLLPEDRSRALCESSQAPVEPDNIAGLFLNIHY